MMKLNKILCRGGSCRQTLGTVARGETFFRFIRAYNMLPCMSRVFILKGAYNIFALCEGYRISSKIRPPKDLSQLLIVPKSL